MKKATKGRRRYPLSVKLQAVDAVLSGKKLTHVATEYGLPPQTLINWLKNHRVGTLSQLVRLSVEEMECIRDCCELMLGSGLLVDEALATQKVMMGLDKKITKMLNQSQNPVRKNDTSIDDQLLNITESVKLY